MLTVSLSENLSSATTFELNPLIENPRGLEHREDLGVVIPQLAPMDFYRLAIRCREESLLELLLPHASAEQLTVVFDLDGWKGDRIEVEKTRSWLLHIIETYLQSNDGRGKLAKLIFEMDPEMWTWSLIHGTAIAELDPEDDSSRELAHDDLASLYTYDSPDGFFVIGVPDQEFSRATIRIIDAIYADDLQAGTQLVLSIKWALMSPIEEELLNFRNGRLADLGFPPIDQAMQLFRPLSMASLQTMDSGAVQDPNASSSNSSTSKPKTAPESEPASILPSSVTVQSSTWQSQGAILRKVMERLSDAEHGLRSREFLLLVNELMVAQRLHPGSEEDQHQCILQADATINLAFEIIMADMLRNQELRDVEPELQLAEMLRCHGFRSLFRLGYGPLAKLRKAVIALHRGGQISLNSFASLIDRPWGPCLKELSQWMPQQLHFSADNSKPTCTPIQTLSEVAQSTQIVTQAAALSRVTFLSEGLAVDPVWLSRADQPEHITLGDLVRTALVLRCQSTSTQPFAPLRADQLHWARVHLLDQNRLRDNVREELKQACHRLGIENNHGKAIAEAILPRLEFELAALEYDDDQQPILDKVGGLLCVSQVQVWLQTGLSPVSTSI